MSAALLRAAGAAAQQGARRHRTAPYDPSSEAGLVLDLWAEAGVTEAGTGVSSWVDGVAGVDFVQTTDGKRPTYEAAGLGGKPSVLGVRANADALVAAAFANVATSYTLIAFCDPLSSASGIYYFLDSQTGRLIFAQAANGANVGYYDGTFRGIAAQTTGSQALTWVLENGVGGAVLRGNTSLGSAAYTAKSMSGGCGVFGSYTGTQNADARIGRLMLFSTIDGTRDGRVRTWGASHYGISL